MKLTEAVVCAVIALLWDVIYQVHFLFSDCKKDRLFWFDRATSFLHGLAFLVIAITVTTRPNIFQFWTIWVLLLITAWFFLGNLGAFWNMFITLVNFLMMLFGLAKPKGMERALAIKCLFLGVYGGLTVWQVLIFFRMVRLQ